MTPSHAAAQPAKTNAVRADFEDLFEAHWDRICQTLYRLTGDWDEAQDLALETFVQLYSRPPAENCNLAGWLYRVAMNLGFNALRAHRRRKQYEEQAGQQGILAITEDPSQEVEQIVERQHVRRVLQSLKPRSARILLLRHSGLSYAEIAEALDIAPGSVGTLLSRAEREFVEAFGG
jgi:RNA polymerase sigma-70 factor (ECF subfamily)